VNQKNGPSETACQTCDHERNEDAPGDIQFLRVSAAACGGPDPKRKRVRSVGGNRGHASKQESRKCYKAATARNGVDAASEGSGKEKKDGVVKVQAEVVSRLAARSLAGKASLKLEVGRWGIDKEKNPGTTKIDR